MSIEALEKEVEELKQHVERLRNRVLNVLQISPSIQNIISILQTFADELKLELYQDIANGEYKFRKKEQKEPATEITPAGTNTEQ